MPGDSSSGGGGGGGGGGARGAGWYATLRRKSRKVRATLRPSPSQASLTSAVGQAMWLWGMWGQGQGQAPRATTLLAGSDPGVVWRDPGGGGGSGGGGRRDSDGGGGGSGGNGCPGATQGHRRSLAVHSLRRSRSEMDVTTLQQLKDEISEVAMDMEAVETGEDGKADQKKKQLSIGRKKFNMDPKKGIEYLKQHELLQDTAEDIAEFLHRGEGLNKRAIGDYLGERADFNQAVLAAFVNLHDFSDLILVQALRQFLWSFRLPGESQKIDRMMECFAKRYCELNPDIFTSADTCYTLSFAIIMLNTSLHNPSVKDKFTVDQFINMVRGIDQGGNLPRELLVSLYDSIKSEPFMIPEDDGNDLMHTFFNPDKEGWLSKQGGRVKSWKRRWFILNDNCLYYFEYTTDKEPRGIIPLENIQVRVVEDRSKPNCFELYASGTDYIKACKTDNDGKVVEGKHTAYRMSAATQEEMYEWIKTIQQSISLNPFYDMLAARKRKAQKPPPR